ncbi:hypothetical protein QN360_18350, partial [Glaciimonas sp. CA11.2]|uniref:hypothetical protein n=1 Tax=Glaciimonas sp. CA11.2 TaxID=3048601 RepID=UPI002B22CCDA
PTAATRAITLRLKHFIAFLRTKNWHAEYKNWQQKDAFLFLDLTINALCNSLQVAAQDSVCFLEPRIRHRVSIRDLSP